MQVDPFAVAMQQAAHGHLAHATLHFAQCHDRGLTGGDDWPLQAQSRAFPPCTSVFKAGSPWILTVDASGSRALASLLNE